MLSYFRFFSILVFPFLSSHEPYQARCFAVTAFISKRQLNQESPPIRKTPIRASHRLLLTFISSVARLPFPPIPRETRLHTETSTSLVSRERSSNEIANRDLDEGERACRLWGNRVYESSAGQEIISVPCTHAYEEGEETR